MSGRGKDHLLARADSAAKSLKDMGMGAFIADLAAALRVERAARERAEELVTVEHDRAEDHLAAWGRENAARERAEQQLAAITQHLPLLRGAIADYELLGPARLDHTMRSLVRRVRALLDASATETPCPTCGGKGEIQNYDSAGSWWLPCEDCSEWDKS